MAKVDVQSKKRKGASESTVSVSKKVKTTPEKTEKSKTLRSAVKKAPVDVPIASPAPEAKKSGAKPARKRAEDFLVEEKKPEKTTKTTKSKKVVEAAPEPVAVKESASAKVSKNKGKKTAEKPVEKEIPVAAAEEDDDDDDEEDDQTAALLAGFDSSEDENEPEEDNENEEGLSLDKLPAIPDEKKTRKQLKDAEKAEENKPGVIYVGRIPHGFFEHQMKAYFTQFGEITHLRLSRNKVTGRSKHYAFIEFASSAVADIVAKTMDKYLLFGHLLQVRRIPAEQVHAQLWKGEGRRFKVMPRNKIEGGQLNKGKTREVWEKKIAKENKKREKQAAKLKEIGYEFDMPALTSVNDVPMKDAADADGPGLLDGGEVKAILDKQPEAEIVTEKAEEAEKVKVAAGTKRVKAKSDGKKTKKAKTAA